jgi:integrase
LNRVRKVKLDKEKKRLRFLSVEEAQGLVSVCDDHLRPIVVTALNTGMRRGEILGLKWENVDLQHGFVLLSKTKNGERREIPVNDSLKAVFQRLPRRIDCQYVFHDPKTLKPYKEVKRSFETALTRAGITDFHFHDLRHTFASQLVMAGIDLVAVKELLGHKDIKMTLRYAHLAPAHKRKAVNVLDSLLNTSPICTPATDPNYTITAQETKKKSRPMSANSLI